MPDALLAPDISHIHNINDDPNYSYPTKFLDIMGCVRLWHHNGLLWLRSLRQR